METCLAIRAEPAFNFDYVFSLEEDSIINKKKLWDGYASMFPAPKDFKKEFDKCTKNNRAIEMDNNKPSSNVTDKVFWFKKREGQEPFKFGTRQFMNLHKKYYDQFLSTTHKKNMSNSKNDLFYGL